MNEWQRDKQLSLLFNQHFRLVSAGTKGRGTWCFPGTMIILSLWASLDGVVLSLHCQGHNTTQTQLKQGVVYFSFQSQKFQSTVGQVGNGISLVSSQWQASLISKSSWLSHLITSVDTKASAWFRNQKSKISARTENYFCSGLQ